MSIDAPQTDDQPRYDKPDKLRSRLLSASNSYALVPVTWVEGAAADLEKMHAALTWIAENGPPKEFEDRAREALT